MDEFMSNKSHQELERSVNREDCAKCDRFKGSRWFCGDKKKLRETIKKFARTSTMHGSVYLYPRSNTRCVCLWRVFLLFCFLFVSVQVVNLTLEALDNHSVSVTTVIKEVEDRYSLEQEKLPEYPGVTICRSPPVKSSSDENWTKMIKYAYLSLGSPFVSLTPEERSVLLNLRQEDKEDTMQYMTEAQELYIAYKEAHNVTLRQILEESSLRCEDIFKSCIAEIITLDCCSMFRPVLTSLGMCFTVKSNEEFRSAFQLLKEFTFIVDLYAPPKRTGKIQQVGFKIMFFDPRLRKGHLGSSSNVIVGPNSVVSIDIALIFTNREALYDTWYQFGSDCPSLPESVEPDPSKRLLYSSKTCAEQYWGSFVRNKCFCQSIVDEGMFEMETCEPHSYFHCFVSEVFKENATGMRKVCRPPCTEISFKVRPTYASLSGPNESHPMSRIVIQPVGKSYIFNEYKRFTISVFFSQLGGATGLLLGASVITFVEFVAFLFQVLWYFLIPSRRKKVEECDELAQQRARKHCFGKDINV